MKSVDRENSTHLNADGCGRLAITKRLKEFDRKELIECLKNPDYEGMKLVKEIAKKLLLKKDPEKIFRSQVSFVIMLAFIYLKGLIIRTIIQSMIVF